MSHTVVTPRFHYPAVDTAAVITIAADTDAIHVIEGIQGGYNAAPSDGKLTVSFGGTTKFQVPIDATGHFQFRFNFGGEDEQSYGGLHNNAKNEEVVITLTSGGASVTGFINAQTRSI